MTFAHLLRVEWRHLRKNSLSGGVDFAGSTARPKTCSSQRRTARGRHRDRAWRQRRTRCNAAAGAAWPSLCGEGGGRRMQALPHPTSSSPVRLMKLIQPKMEGYVTKKWKVGHDVLKPRPMFSHAPRVHLTKKSPQGINKDACLSVTNNLCECSTALWP